MRKDIATRINVKEEELSIRARTVGADNGEAKVVTRALIVEAVAHKSKEIKTACMENLSPDRTNMISGNQVFVPFGNIEGFNDKTREKWIRRQNLFLKQVTSVPITSFNEAKEAHAQGGSQLNPREFFMRKIRGEKRTIWSIEEMGPTTLLIFKKEHKAEVEKAIEEWNQIPNNTNAINKPSIGHPLSEAAKSYAQALITNTDFDPFDFPELSPSKQNKNQPITPMPTQGPTLMPHTPKKETIRTPIATPSPRKNAWIEHHNK